MKVLIYADVHANLFALDELQKTEDYHSADLRIFLGDAVCKGAFSNECLTRIFDSGDIFLLGNHDVFCAYGLPTKRPWKEEKIAYIKFIQSKISAENLEKLKGLGTEFWLEKFGKKFFFTHYPWKEHNYIFETPDDQNAPGEKTAKLFEQIDADHIFFGHVHKAADFEADGKKFCCVGSLGINRPINRGDYVVLDISEEKVSTERKHVYFDPEKLRQAILAENSPLAVKYAKWFEA